MGGSRLFIAVLALFAAIAASVTARSAEGGEGAASGGQPDEGKTITISGRVVDALTGAPVAGAGVSTLDITVQADQEGRYVVSGVPGTRDAILNFRVVGEDGSVMGCAFIATPVSLMPVSARFGDKVAVAVAETVADVPGFDLTLVEVKGAAVEEVCVVCHKPNPCLAAAKEGQGWSDVTHLGGVEVTERQFEETKARVLAEGVRASDYPSLRYQDAHPQRVDVAAAVANKPTQFKLPELLVLAEGVTATCDTCHTRHEPTENSLFLHLDIATHTLLCRQCHT